MKNLKEKDIHMATRQYLKKKPQFAQPTLQQPTKVRIIQPDNYLRKPQRGVKLALIPTTPKKLQTTPSSGMTHSTLTPQSVLTKQQQQHQPTATVKSTTGIDNLLKAAKLIAHKPPPQLQPVASVKRPLPHPAIPRKKKPRTEKWEQYVDGAMQKAPARRNITPTSANSTLRQKQKGLKYPTERETLSHPNKEIYILEDPTEVAQEEDGETEEEEVETEEEEEEVLEQEAETEEETEEEVEEVEQEETQEETEEEEEQEEEQQQIEEPMCVDQMDGTPTTSISLPHSLEKSKNEKIYPTLVKQLKRKEKLPPNEGTCNNSVQTVPVEQVPVKVNKQVMLTPYIPPTFPVIMLHIGRGRYLSGGYVDGAHVIRIQDNYPKKYEDERRRFVKLNIAQFLDLVSYFGTVSGEVNRLKTAKQSSINEEDRKHIGRNVYVSIFRSTDDNLFVDIRQFYVPEDDFAKGNCRLVPTKAGISLRVAEWEQLTKVAHHMKTFMPALKNATRCIASHEYQEHIEMCPHCTPNWMC